MAYRYLMFELIRIIERLGIQAFDQRHWLTYLRELRQTPGSE